MLTSKTSLSEQCAGDPPQCCVTPKECPECHSQNIFPTFDPTIDYFECVPCGNVWEVAR